MKSISFFLRYIFYLQFLIFLLLYYQIKLSFYCIFNYRNVSKWADIQVVLNATRLLKATSILGLYPVFLNRPEDVQLPPEPFLIISNHQSLLDPLLLIALFNKQRVRFVFKDALLHGFLYVSAVMRVQRHAGIDRNNPKQSIPEIRRLQRYSRETKANVVLFPEGTRNRNSKVGEFKTAAIRTLLRKNPMPLVVVGIQNGYRLPTLVITKRIEPGNYYVKILDVYPLVDSKNVISVLEEAREKIQTEIDQWT